MDIRRWIFHGISNTSLCCQMHNMGKWNKIKQFI
eukprot:Gb_19017 [translate_table: standard]